jgi:muramoyltetrapeptide carboxypeptidase LdcA involved in peptidoglycan recycling
MREPLLRPPPLEPGDLIGVFTPSAPAHVRFREKYLHGVSQLRALGFRVIEGSLTARGGTQGYRSGTPVERAAEFMELLGNPEVKGMISTIGGMNSSSMIPYLDFDAIRANPRVICGYSDVTSLHLAILAYSGLSTFYGPAVMASFGDWPEVLPETRDSFLEAVQRHRSGSRPLNPPERWSRHFRDAGTDAWKTEPRQFEPHDGWRVLAAGRASGPVIVANLNTLLSAAGTPYFPDLEGTVLLLEEMSAPWDLEERSFRHLQLLGVFERIAGLIVGKPEVPNQQGAPFSYDELILEVVGRRDYPIISQFDCGHTVPMLTLAQMTPITIVATEGSSATVTIDAPMVAG